MGTYNPWFSQSSWGTLSILSWSYLLFVLFLAFSCCSTNRTWDKAWVPSSWRCPLAPVGTSQSNKRRSLCWRSQWLKRGEASHCCWGSLRTNEDFVFYLSQHYLWYRRVHSRWWLRNRGGTEFLSCWDGSTQMVLSSCLPPKREWRLSILSEPIFKLQTIMNYLDSLSRSSEEDRNENEQDLPIHDDNLPIECMQFVPTVKEPISCFDIDSIQFTFVLVHQCESICRNPKA